MNGEASDVGLIVAILLVVVIVPVVLWVVALTGGCLWIAGFGGCLA